MTDEKIYRLGIPRNGEPTAEIYLRGRVEVIGQNTVHEGLQELTEKQEAKLIAKGIITKSRPMLSF